MALRKLGEEKVDYRMEFQLLFNKMDNFHRQKLIALMLFDLIIIVVNSEENKEICRKNIIRIEKDFLKIKGD